MNETFLSNVVYYYVFHQLYSIFNDEITLMSGTLVDECCKKINVYSLSSFNYSILGLYSIKYPIGIKYYDSFYPYFLLNQGIVSYLSDSLYIDRNHWSHYYDRTFAMYNSISLLLILKKFKLTKLNYIMLILGILVKKIDEYYSKKNNIKMYCKFHTLWHTIIPIVAPYIIRNNPRQIV